MYTLNLTQTQFLIVLAALKTMELASTAVGSALHKNDLAELRELIMCMSDAWETIGAKGERLSATHRNRG